MISRHAVRLALGCLTALVAVLCAASPATAHMVSPDVGDFYAGMLHPLTSAEHLLPMLALAVLVGQCGRRAVRAALPVFPATLAAGVLAGARLPAPVIAFVAGAVGLSLAGLLLMVAPRLASWKQGRGAVAVCTICAALLGLALGWRSGGDMAASSVGWRFVPGVAVTGFVLVAVLGAWLPPLVSGWRGVLRLVLGAAFTVSGLLVGLGLFGSGPGVAGLFALPAEKELAARILGASPGPGFLLIALLVAFVWGAAHALTPGHGKALVGAYLVGSRGTAGQAVLLGLTVTVTHTLGVYLLGAAALLAAGSLDRERLYPWLALASGLGVTGIGLLLVRDRLRQTRHGATDGHAHSHGGVSHSHGGIPHSHGGVSHSHGNPADDGARPGWHRLVALGISGGLLPCPSALVLMLGAIAVGRIGFGLALVAAFSLGLAGVLTAVGLLFLKGAGWLRQSARWRNALRWLPLASALAVTVLGAALSWEAAARLLAF
jgi:ABC-type nickel/cobalt efflux system permease component RcnA/hydrogenase/urease accessory protein HupE